MGCGNSHNSHTCPSASEQHTSNRTRPCGPSASEQHHSSPESCDFHQDYLLGTVLGKGTFAQVRICKRAELSPKQEESRVLSAIKQQETAVKILALKDLDKKTADQLPEECSKRRKAADKEVVMWRKLGSHPNCVRLHEIYIGDTFCYMVMEKLQGGFLKVLENMPVINESTLAGVFSQMLLAINHCHNVGVVHRDIKPENYMTGGTNFEIVKLGDFGVSTILPMGEIKLRGHFGTAPYMSPEMIAEQGYSEKTDIWSLGVIAYVLFFGEFPYMPAKRTCKDMKAAIKNGGAPSYEPMQHPTGSTSVEAKAWIESMLSRDEDARQSAQECLDDPFFVAARSMHQLPDLTPMLDNAKAGRCFSSRDPSQHVTPIDVELNRLNFKRHGINFISTSDDAMTKSEFGKSDRSHASTTVGSSSADSSVDYGNRKSSAGSSALPKRNRSINGHTPNRL